MLDMPFLAGQAVQFYKYEKSLYAYGQFCWKNYPYLLYYIYIIYYLLNAQLTTIWDRKYLNYYAAFQLNKTYIYIQDGQFNTFSPMSSKYNYLSRLVSLPLPQPSHFLDASATWIAL